MGRESIRGGTFSLSVSKSSLSSSFGLLACHTSPDPFRQAVPDWTNVDHMFEIAKNPFDGGQLLVAKDYVPRREAVVRGANEELPIQALLLLDLLVIDTEPSCLRLMDVAVEHRMRAQCARGLFANGFIRDPVAFRHVPYGLCPDFLVESFSLLLDLVHGISSSDVHSAGCMPTRHERLQGYSVSSRVVRCGLDSTCYTTASVW